MGGVNQLSEHHDRVGQLAEALDEVRLQAQALGSEEVADRLLLEADRLRERRFRLVVIGEFSRGKSTLINALLGVALLPAKLRPTTATLIEITHGPALRVRVQEHDGTQREIGPGEIAAAVSVGGEQLERVRRVLIEHPSPLLARGLVVVDTPGVNDLATMRQDLTIGHLPAADAVLFVLDAKACFTESERLFLAQDVLRSSVGRVLFVVNKTDQLDPPYDRAQVEALVDRVRAFAGPFTDVARVIPVAARAALRARLEGDGVALAASGLPELEATLARFLVEEAGELHLGRALRHGLMALDALAQGVEIRRSLLGEEQSAAVGRVGELRQRAAAAAEALTARKVTWDSHCERLIDQARVRAQEELRRVQTDLARVPVEAHAAQGLSILRETGQVAATVAVRGREALEAEIAGLARELQGEVAALPAPLARTEGPRGSLALTPVQPEERLFTAPAALAAAGAMGLAALVTSLVPGGILLVGAAAFLFARAAESHAAAPGRAARERALADLTEASRRLDDALAAHGREVSRAAWAEVAGPTVQRHAAAQAALTQAERDLDEKDSARQLRGTELARVSERLAEARVVLMAAGTGSAVLGREG